MSEEKDYYQEFFQSGKVENKKRRALWKELLDIPTSFTPTIAPSFEHPDFAQVEKDVNRSFIHVTDANFKTRRRQQLLNITMSVLERHKLLHYYQGFHHIVSIILTFAREPLAMLICERLALGPLLPFFQTDLAGLTSMVNLTMSIIKLADKELWKHFDDNEFDCSFSAPYILCWFTQESPSLETALQYLDFFVMSNPIMPVYLLVAYILERKSIFLTKNDYDELFMAARDLTSGIDPLKSFEVAIELFKKFPPVVLLNSDPKLTISKKVTFLNPRVEYPFPFPTFPHAQVLPFSVYEKHLSEEKTNSRLLTGILSALAILGTIGLRMLDL